MKNEINDQIIKIKYVNMKSFSAETSAFVAIDALLKEQPEEKEDVEQVTFCAAYLSFRSTVFHIPLTSKPRCISACRRGGNSDASRVHRATLH